MFLKKIGLFLLVVFLFSNLVSADMILPGQRRIDYCAKIVNTHEFPDYIFLSFDSSGMTTVSVISDNSCITGSKYGASILAVPADKLELVFDFEYQYNSLTEESKELMRRRYNPEIMSRIAEHLNLSDEERQELASHELRYLEDDRLKSYAVTIGKIVGEDVFVVEESVRIFFLANQWDVRNRIVENYEVVMLSENNFTLKSSRETSYDPVRFSLIFGLPFVALIILSLIAYSAFKEGKNDS